MSEGTISTSADGTGQFRLSRLPVGRYLVVLYTPGFSMRVNSGGCAALSDGIFVEETKPGYMFGCKIIRINADEETSIYQHFTASAY
jgi:hypothetical protein